MDQVILETPGKFVFTASAAEPRAAVGEALVRVRRVGICGSDIHAFAGRQPFFKYPRILGHELGVEVIEAPANDRGIQPGSRCAVEPYLNCGDCHACKIGKPNCCEHMQVLGVHRDGGMRTYFCVPVDKLHKSEKLTWDQLALVETLSIGAQAVRRGGVTAGERALVVGAGPIGLGAIQFAMAEGAVVSVLDISESRREFVRRAVAIETLAEPDGTLYDVVFDATGNRTAMQQSFNHVAAGGRLVFIGLIKHNIEFDDIMFHSREMTLYASRNSCGLFPDIIRKIEEGRIDTRPWITHRLSLREVPARFVEITQQADLLKAIIEL